MEYSVRCVTLQSHRRFCVKHSRKDFEDCSKPIRCLTQKGSAEMPLGNDIESCDNVGCLLTWRGAQGSSGRRPEMEKKVEKLSAAPLHKDFHFGAAPPWQSGKIHMPPCGENKPLTGMLLGAQLSQHNINFVTRRSDGCKQRIRLLRLPSRPRQPECIFAPSVLESSQSF